MSSVSTLVYGNIEINFWCPSIEASLQGPKSLMIKHRNTVDELDERNSKIAGQVN